jgi:hypothetical protein
VSHRWTRAWGLFLGLLLWFTAAFDARADMTGAARTGATTSPQGAQLLPEDMIALTGSVPPPPESYDTYDGGWIRFAFPAGSRARVQPLIVEADTAREYFRQLFGFPVLKNVTVYVARTADEMVSLAPEGHPYPGYAAGVAYPYLDLVLLTVFPKQHNPDFDLKQVFKHELAHLALKDAVAGAHVPRWLNEGFAVHFSGESSLERMKTLWTASLARTLLPLREIDARFPNDAVETPSATCCVRAIASASWRCSGACVTGRRSRTRCPTPTGSTCRGSKKSGSPTWPSATASCRCC